MLVITTHHGGHLKVAALNHDQHHQYGAVT
jgi:hypothetical protein